MSAAVVDLHERMRFCDSYTRLPTLLNAFFDADKAGHDGLLEWFRVLGDIWTYCDNIGRYRRELNLILSTASAEQRAAMMTGEERAALAASPTVLTVYRGAYGINRRGLSWSLSRDVAVRFPFLARYAQYSLGEQPILLTGRVRRDRCVLKLDRNEHEIVATKIRIVESMSLPMPEQAMRAAA